MQLLIAVLSVVVGLVVSFLIYYLLHLGASKLPPKWYTRVLPYVFIGPVLILIAVFLLYPTIRTIVLSFLDPAGQEFVGLDNYVALFTNGEFLGILLNNLLWILIVPATAVVLGLAVAVFADRVDPLSEKTFKSTIFFPMAISGIAAATIWRFMYSYEAPGSPQVGLLNAIWTSFGADPVPWLTISDFRLNSLLLMVIVIWLNTGFAMVLLSAAIKSVPEETIEAAYIDGASRRQTFYRIIVPQIRSSIVAVFVTILIGVMKIFDVVYAMTGGNFSTSVLGMEFINQLFAFGNPAAASAVVVILMIAVVPVMVYQVRTYRKQEALR